MKWMNLFNFDRLHCCWKCAQNFKQFIVHDTNVNKKMLEKIHNSLALVFHGIANNRARFDCISSKSKAHIFANVNHDDIFMHWIHRVTLLAKLLNMTVALFANAWEYAPAVNAVLSLQQWQKFNLYIFFSISFQAANKVKTQQKAKEKWSIVDY